MKEKIKNLVRCGWTNEEASDYFFSILDNGKNFDIISVTLFNKSIKHTYEYNKLITFEFDNPTSIYIESARFLIISSYAQNPFKLDIDTVDCENIYMKRYNGKIFDFELFTNNGELLIDIEVNLP